jgi:phage terminase large subunit-like protein
MNSTSLSHMQDPDLPLSETLLLTLEAEKNRRLNENRLAYFKPYPKQISFFTAGATYRERLLMAGNQCGKSLASAMELAMHATGQYREWWEGFRFDRPIRAWACGETSEVVRETLQLLLLGPPGQHGTGCIPKASLIEAIPARGLADLVDTIRVKHESGGTSTIALKAYSQGRERFQGATIDYLALDEEPPFEIFTEALTRTNVTQGPVVLTFTPLKGVSSVVKRFIHGPSPDRNVTVMTLSDAAHYTEEERQKIIAQYPEHERATRTRGIPAMGSGRVFVVDEEKLLVEPFECPSHWVKIGGIDFGYDHPAAFVECWWDRDLDVFYLVRTLRLRHQTPLQHVEAIRHWRLRWAWPHDGRQQTLAGAGVPLMRQYKDAGLDMLHDHAQFEDGGISVEAGVQEMHDRMRGGRWKVFRGANDDWLEEYSMYHRKDGLLVKDGEDAISASRYAMVMRRFGQSKASSASFNRQIVYPKQSIA